MFNAPTRYYKSEMSASVDCNQVNSLVNASANRTIIATITPKQKRLFWLVVSTHLYLYLIRVKIMTTDHPSIINSTSFALWILPLRHLEIDWLESFAQSVIMFDCPRWFFLPQISLLPDRSIFVQSRGFGEDDWKWDECRSFKLFSRFLRIPREFDYVRPPSCQKCER